MIDLKPYPFCGGEAKIYASTIGVSVKCMNCYVQTETYIDMCYTDFKMNNATERTIEAWNRRIYSVVNIDKRNGGKGFPNPPKEV